MSRFHPIKALRRAVSALYDQALRRARRFAGQTDEVLTDIPIDFSAPSIPYYKRLAERLSFVRIVLYMILVVFVTVTVVSNHRLITYENLYYLAKDIGAATLTAQSTADQISYPISSSDTDFALFRGGIVEAVSLNNFYKALLERDDMQVIKNFKVLPGYTKKWKIVSFIYAIFAVVLASSLATPIATIVTIFQNH